MSNLHVEQSGSMDFGPCPCCGGSSRTVGAYVYDPASETAAYFVQWTLGHVDLHGANVDLIIGKWGDDSLRSDRFGISLNFRMTDQGPAFMIIDSAERPVGSSELVGKALSRSEVIGTPLAEIAFRIVDAIWLQDIRIREVADWTQQAGAGQPATRPESKQEGGDKPQPEAEGRSQ